MAPPWGLLVLPIGHISSMSVQHWTSESWILESGEVALVMGSSSKQLKLLIGGNVGLSSFSNSSIEQ